MNKKYRLVIPDMIKKEYAAIASVVEIYEGCRITLGDNPTWNSVPKEWLQEIKQPMMFDEWFADNMPPNGTSTKDFGRKCHEWTVENERLKQEPKESFDSYFKNSLAKEAVSYGVAKAIWDDCEKNRGYDEN